MVWTMKLRLLESCSCAQVCPCVLGPAKPDQEWCSGVFGMEVAEGDAEGVDLAGAKIVLHFELPGDFLGGIDKAKLYFDPSVSDAQRAQLDSILHGEKGGVWGGASRRSTSAATMPPASRSQASAKWCCNPSGPKRVALRR